MKTTSHYVILGRLQTSVLVTILYITFACTYLQKFLGNFAQILHIFFTDIAQKILGGKNNGCRIIHLQDNLFIEVHFICSYVLN